MLKTARLQIVQALENGRIHHFGSNAEQLKSVTSQLRIFKLRPEAVVERQFGVRYAIATATSLAYPVIAFELGFFVTTFLFLLVVPAAFIRTDAAARSVDHAPASVLASVIYAAIATAFLYVSFQVLLKFSLPAGALL